MNSVFIMTASPIAAFAALVALTACTPQSTKAPATTQHEPIIVFAAASLTDAITQVNDAYTARHHTPVQSSFLASSTLAKQIDNGAKADIFISADVDWVQFLQQKNLIKAANTKQLLGNELVIIAPNTSNIQIDMQRPTLSEQFTGKLCTGNTDTVPVGKYAKQSLMHLGWWQSIVPRLVATEDARLALNFVNRGECALGIVYKTDAAIANNVKIVGTFSQNSHTPITYPAALMNDNHAPARDYYDFLQSDEAKQIFSRHGFTLLQDNHKQDSL